MMDTHLRGWHPLISYCDKCAKKYDYPTNEEKIKGSCVFCRSTGSINQVHREGIVDLTDFNEEIWKGGGFKIIQQIPFPPKQLHDRLYPSLPRKMINRNCLIFYDKNFLIVANSKTGQQISIEFLETANSEQSE